MSELMPGSSPVVLPDFAAGQAGRWKHLQDERRFRVEQLAALDAELAACQRGRGVKLALHIAATSALSEIDGALVRMAEGEYGQCVSCAQPIPDARLDVLPSASLCMPCHFNAQNCVSRGSEAWLA